MSSMTSKQDRIHKARENFSVALESALPMTHFSQVYDELEFDKLAQQQAKKCLAKFQEDSSEFDMNEIGAVTNELIQRFQEIVEQWKVKNEENKTKCKHFLQGQVDFLVSDFRTSLMIQLILAPDVGLQDLETFLEGRKTVLIDIFEKLSKPGEPRSQSSVDMKKKLSENLDCVKKETLEKQSLLLEQKAITKSQKVLEDVKGRIMKIAMKLKSDLSAYQGKTPKELVKGKLAEINYFLSMKGKGLQEYPNIHSTILRTTAEVRKCLHEKDYKDMSAVEFAETLHEQLLFDFAGGDRAGLNPCVMDSIGSSDESASSKVLVIEEELLTGNDNDESENCNNESESELPSLPNELQYNSVVEEHVKEEKEDLVNHDKREMNLRNSSDESALKCSGDDGAAMEVERANEVERSASRFDNNLQSGSVKPNKSNKHVFNKNIGSRRRSARLHLSSHPVAEKCSRQKRKCIAAAAKKKTNDEYSRSRSEHSEDPTTDESNEDSNPSPKRFQVSSSKSQPNRRKSLHAGTRFLTKDEVTPSADKITYLHLKGGIPYYRCNVCKRKCRQGLLRYHGEFCGVSNDPFACQECGRACLSRGELEKHSRVHTGAKPFKCSKCPARFAWHSAMLRHMRSHEMAGRFLCKPCKLVFVSGTELHIHNKAKHLENLPFGCFYCERRFKKLCLLKAHVIVHADERPYQCPTCGIHYAMKQVLRKHLHSVHHRSRQTAIKLANQSALDYLRREMKDQSFDSSDILPYSEINMLVTSHIIEKAKLRIPEVAA